MSDTPVETETVSSSSSEESKMLQDVGTVPDSKTTPPPMSKRMKKKMQTQQKAMVEMFRRYQQKQAKDKSKLKQEVATMRGYLGEEDFKALRDICTIHTPEQKNEQGEVTVKASSFVNNKALLREARLVLVLKREDRIKMGKRKRSTGRSSDRKAHQNTLNFINMRNDTTLKSEPLKQQHP
jgi:hypothetical protein